MIDMSVFKHPEIDAMFRSFIGGTDDLDTELAALNAEVDAALAKRKSWMDEHMKDYAKAQVGEELYDLSKMRLLGTVTELYRYQSNQNPLYDTHMSVHYKYVPAGYQRAGYGNIIDNTSRQSMVSVGNADAYKKRLESEAKFLEYRASLIKSQPQ